VEVLIVLAVLVVVGLIARAILKQQPKSATAVALNQRLASIRYMSGPQFEHFVADVMRGLGYRAQVLGGSGDQGVDVIATGGNERLAIQCKQYRRPVGNKPIQEVFAGAKHHRCTTAWVVAPEGFTKGAVELARSVGVALHDAQSLQAWIRQIDKNTRSQDTLVPPTVDLDEIDRRERNSATVNSGIVDLDVREDTMDSGAEKQTVKVGLEDGSVGETVSFTADLLGTAQVNGGADGGGMDYTYYRLPDGNFRVLVESGGITVLVPSDMEEAISRGQRSNYSYGRMTLEEMQAETTYKFGEIYAQLMENHPETGRNRVRDID
jgi:restriction system protein